MTQSTAVGEPYPLDQIRQAEVTVARTIAAARQSAQDAIQHAEQQAAELRLRAQEIGHREGLEEYDSIVRAAEREAQTLIEQANEQARRLRHRGELLRDLAVLHAVALVSGQETGDR